VSTDNLFELEDNFKPYKKSTSSRLNERKEDKEKNNSRDNLKEGEEEGDEETKSLILGNKTSSNSNITAPQNKLNNNTSDTTTETTNAQLRISTASDAINNFITPKESNSPVEINVPNEPSKQKDPCSSKEQNTSKEFNISKEPSLPKEQSDPKESNIQQQPQQSNTLNVEKSCKSKSSSYAKLDENSHNNTDNSKKKDKEIDSPLFSRKLIKRSTLKSLITTTFRRKRSNSTNVTVNNPLRKTKEKNVVKSMGNIFNPPDSTENSIENLRPMSQFVDNGHRNIHNHIISEDEGTSADEDPTAANMLPSTSVERKNSKIDNIEFTYRSRESNLDQ